MNTKVGILGGSGLYDIPGLEKVKWDKIHTPFGLTSDDLCMGELSEVPVYFMPRHGRGHRLTPSGINYRANIHAFKQNGVTDIISVSAVGSLNEKLEPGTFVIVDQFIDRTFAREKSFFENGMVAHVSMAEPVCSRLGDILEESAKEEGIKVARGGTYLVMEGPQFSTKAESKLYRQWGCDVIGMTNMPEAKLAREAEMCYATVAMVTDFDCWHEDHGHVNVEAVIKVLNENADKARALIARAIPKMNARPEFCNVGCNNALDNAVVTAPSVRDAETVEKLWVVAGRVM